MANLFDNSLRYAPTGDVTLSAQTTTEQVELMVVDEGPGIPPEAGIGLSITGEYLSL